MPLDHIGINVTDPVKSTTFYTSALAPLNYGKLMEVPKEYTNGVAVIGFGSTITKHADLWITEGPNKQTPPVHVAFKAENHAQVDAFYKAALASGGKDNGPPGPRPDYHKDYYAAFVHDPDGHNIEVVCLVPQTEAASPSKEGGADKKQKQDN